MISGSGAGAFGTALAATTARFFGGGVVGTGGVVGAAATAGLLRLRTGRTPASSSNLSRKSFAACLAASFGKSDAWYSCWGEFNVRTQYD